MKIYTVKNLLPTPALQAAQFSPIPNQLPILASYKSYPSFFKFIQANKNKDSCPLLSTQKLAIILPLVGAQ